MIRARLAAIALLAATSSAVAAEGVEALTVPADEAYVHKATDLEFPPKLLTFDTRRIVRYGSDDDISGDYHDHDNQTAVTVYLTRVGTPDPSLWFDRASSSMLNNPRFAGIVRENVEASFFIAPGFNRESGIMAVYGVERAGIISTGLALMAYDDYLVKIRASSGRLDTIALAQLMRDAINALTMPKPTGIEPRPYIVADCETPLHADASAVQVTTDGDAGVATVFAMMAGGIGKTVTPEGKPVQLLDVRYCIDPDVGKSDGVYRPDGSENGYLIAYNDTGRAVIVGNGGMTLFDRADQKQGIALIHQVPEGNVVYRPFTTLPDPEAALKVSGNQEPIAFANRDDKVEIYTGKGAAQ